MVKPQQSAAETARLHLALFLLSFVLTAALMRGCGGDGRLQPVFALSSVCGAFGLLGRGLRRLHDRFCFCRYLGRWRQRRKPQRSTSLAFVFGEFMSSVSLTAGQSVAVTPVPLQADGAVTQGASLSNVTLSTNDLTIATVTENADGTFTLKGIAAGTVSLSGSAVVTDPDGAVSTISGSATVVVAAAPPAAQSVSLGFEFGTPA